MAEHAQIVRLRQDRDRELSPRYHWVLHASTNVLVMVVPLALALRSLGPIHGTDLLLGAAFFLVWSLVEYAIHRYILHGRRFARTELYRQHVAAHHGYFTHRFPWLEEPVAVSRVLLFTRHLIAVQALVAGSALALSFWAEPRTACLWLFAGLLFVLAYEGVHAISHVQGADRLRLTRWLAEHHRLHHHPALAETSNFSIVVPAWDFAFGTKREVPHG